MVAILGVAAILGIGVITACIGPLYYWQQLTQGREDEDETSEAETPTVHIKISHPRREKIPDPDSENSIQSNDNKQAGKTVRGADIPPENLPLLPVKPPRSKYKVLTTKLPPSDQQTSREQTSRSTSYIWSATLKEQLRNITDSSSGICSHPNLVRAEVEVHPKNHVSPSHETADPLKPAPLLWDDIDSSKSLSVRACPEDDKARRISALVVKKWRILKKSLVRPRSSKSAVPEEEEADASQRLSIPVPVSSGQSPVGHSTMLRKHRLIDASTSTKISQNILESRERSAQVIAEAKGMERSHGIFSFRPGEFGDRTKSNADNKIMQSMMSLIERNSINEQPVCDLRITGLPVSHSELLDLLAASGDKTKSTSIITTEEASVISIKFHKQREPKDKVTINESANLSLECPLQKLYKNLPERFEYMLPLNLFRAQEQRKGSQHQNHSKVFNNTKNKIW